MPLSERVFEFPNLVGEAFHGAPGLIADSLPDKFGNKVIERWLLEQGKGAEYSRMMENSYMRKMNLLRNYRLRMM